MPLNAQKIFAKGCKIQSCYDKGCETRCDPKRLDDNVCVPLYISNVNHSYTLCQGIMVFDRETLQMCIYNHTLVMDVLYMCLCALLHMCVVYIHKYSCYRFYLCTTGI